MRPLRPLRACCNGIFAVATLCAAALGAHPAPAAAQEQPVVAVVIDDLGNLRHEGLRSVELPGAVTYAVLPHTPHGPTLARLAHALDKEVLVHMPMEATSHRPLGPGGLTAALARHQFERRVLAAFDSVPYARGISNHMGSRLTAMEMPMSWLMKMLSRREGWLFFDSRTTAQTVAEDTARRMGIRTTYRDVFLDNEPREQSIRLRLADLIDRARASGSAVAIGHPYPQTLDVLEQELPRLHRHGVRLVPLSRVVARRSARLVQIAQSSPTQAASTR